MVVAGGSGSRFGGPKQFEPLGTGTVLDSAVWASRAVADFVVVVLPGAAIGAEVTGADAVVPGGQTRSASVRAGLAALVSNARPDGEHKPVQAAPFDPEIVVVHDAARPLASPALFKSVVDAVRAGADAAVPALAVNDTVKRVVGRTVRETVPRDGLFLIQTPQAFCLSVLNEAHSGAADATDDAALVEAVGGTVVVVDGEPANVKLTSPSDLPLLEALVSSGAAAIGAARLG